jgi:hypothetical protein
MAWFPQISARWRQRLRRGAARDDEQRELHLHTGKSATGHNEILCPPARPRTCRLPNRDVNPIVEVDERNMDDQGREGMLVKSPRRLFPYRIGDGVFPVAESRCGFGKRKRGTFGVIKVR